MEIYKLEISFPYDADEEKWIRVIQVSEDTTFKKLHKIIQEIVDFDDDHLYEFYIGKNPRNRVKSISKSSKLSEVYPLTGYKIYYLFDFGDNWFFQIKKSRKNLQQEAGVKYPRLVHSTGVNPEQYPEYEE
ncbi:hypothetical protein GF407_15415 [candidate division KSB1 bacterium]|nr:hypothetical protein [candidate division KSB1 bacterium]